MKRVVFNDKKQFIKFIESLETPEQIDITASLDIIRNENLDYINTKHLRDGIFEIKLNPVNRQIRILFFYAENDIVITDAFIKKHKTEKREYNKYIERAKTIKDNY